MYVLNKIVGFLTSPLAVLFLGLVAGWLLRLSNWRRLGRLCAFVAVAQLWFFSSSVATRLVGVPLERRSGSGCVLDVGGVPASDVIMLLGGGLGAHAECGSAELFSAADRAWMAARLYRAGKAPRIFITGGDVTSSTLPFLRDLGVPDEAMQASPGARNTEEEAKALADSGVRSVLLVTSAWHMPRARLLFERSGLAVTPCPTDFEMSYFGEPPLSWHDFVPNADALQHNSAALKELVALLGYTTLRR